MNIPLLKLLKFWVVSVFVGWGIGDTYAFLVLNRPPTDLTLFVAVWCVAMYLSLVVRQKLVMGQFKKK